MTTSTPSYRGTRSNESYKWESGAHFLDNLSTQAYVLLETWQAMEVVEYALLSVSVYSHLGSNMYTFDVRAC